MRIADKHFEGVSRLISLRKHLHDNPLQVAVDVYRSTLQVIADCGARACPALGARLRDKLLTLRDHACPELLAATGRDVDEELRSWSDRVAKYYAEKTQEIREVLMTLAHTVQSVSERDSRYRGEFRGLAERMNDIGGLEDLAEIRHMLNRQTAEMNACVDKMTREGADALVNLQAQIAVYERRLAYVEKLSSTDPVTSLLNRFGLEAAMAERVRTGTRFCMVVFDLNEFKQINDRFGHLAGDQVLCEFGAELLRRFRAEDVVGRWGGDEFLVLLDCNTRQARYRIEQLRNSLFREYRVKYDSGSCAVHVAAAVGVAEWAPGYSLEMVFRAADTAMYMDKKARHAAESSIGSSPAH